MRHVISTVPREEQPPDRELRRRVARARRVVEQLNRRTLVARQLGGCIAAQLFGARARQFGRWCMRCVTRVREGKKTS